MYLRPTGKGATIRELCGCGEFKYPFPLFKWTLRNTILPRPPGPQYYTFRICQFKTNHELSDFSPRPCRAEELRVVLRSCHCRAEAPRIRFLYYGRTTGAPGVRFLHYGYVSFTTVVLQSCDFRAGAPGVRFLYYGRTTKLRFSSPSSESTFPVLRSYYKVSIFEQSSGSTFPLLQSYYKVAIFEPELREYVSFATVVPQTWTFKLREISGCFRRPLRYELRRFQSCIGHTK